VRVSLGDLGGFEDLPRVRDENKPCLGLSFDICKRDASKWSRRDITVIGAKSNQTDSISPLQDYLTSRSKKM
jgi:hypothetical protein